MRKLTNLEQDILVVISIIFEDNYELVKDMPVFHRVKHFISNLGDVESILTSYKDGESGIVAINRLMTYLEKNVEQEGEHPQKV